MVNDRAKYYIRPREIKKSTARLIAFPYAGAGAVAYYPWASELPRDIELISLQYPGRGRLMDQKLCTNIHELVAEAYETVVTFSHEPFFFFGHSMGALVAFEVVRSLRRYGKTLPAALIVSGREPPQSPPSPKNHVHDLPDDLFLAGLMRYGGIPTEILQSPDMMAFLLPLIRADMTALETWQYKPEKPLSIPIVALGGSEDKTVEMERIQYWRNHTTSFFESIIMSGDHFYFQNQLSTVIDAIDKVIRRSLAAQ